MARDTKVGLIAGLSFIICFAVILANRGGVSLDSMPVLQTGAGPSRIVSDTRVSDTGVQDAVRSRELPRAAHRPSAAAPTAIPSTRMETAKPDSASSTTPATAFADSRKRTEESRSDADMSRQAWREQLEQRLDTLAEAVNAKRASSPAMADALAESDPTATPTSPNPATRNAVALTSKPTRKHAPQHDGIAYRVMSGDTLSRIAAKHYGTSSRRVIDTIFDTNRGLLPSPDELRVGMELHLPQIGDTTSPSPRPARREHDTAAPRREAPQRATPEAPSIRWYQIKKNDRYISIAREQLGDESRWREIFDLNKDKFADPGRIREGVRIKLPARSVARAGSLGA